MKIALLGGPKAGKTELASSLSKHFKAEGKSVVVIDKYVEKLEKRNDMAYGHFATYIGNVQIAIERLLEEKKAKADVVITCGTIIESGVYEAVNAFMSTSTTKEETGKRVHDERANRTMGFLGMMGFDTLSYDHSFYLPHSEEFKSDKDNYWTYVVGDYIPEAADSFSLKYETLGENPLVEALSYILEEDEASNGQPDSGTKEQEVSTSS